MSSIFGIGVSALQNAQYGLMTTGHNITNVNTDGYNRQRVIINTNIAVLTGSGYIGQGAHVSTVERMYSSFLGAQVNQAQTTASSLEAFATQLAQVNNMLADPNSGLSPAMLDFFKGVQQVAADPNAVAGRQALLSSAQAMIARFQGVEGRLSELYEGVNSQLQGYIGSINSYAQQIAKLNEQIINAQAATNQPPNDLYDQRDQLVGELNKLIGVNTSMNTDGSYNVYIGNGQQLVTRTQVSALVAVPTSKDPGRMTVGLSTATGSQEMPESLISGGSISGLLAFRSQFLDRSANELGRIGASMALTFNAQHALGQDLLGNIAGDATFVSNFFTLSGPKVIGNALNPPSAASVTANFISPPPNNGNFYTDLTNSDYQFTYDGTNYTLTRMSDNVSWSGASVAALNTAVATSVQGSQGFTVSVSGGAPAAGSSYLIQPTREVARNLGVNSVIAADVRQIAAAAPVRAQTGSANTGNATITPGTVSTGYTAPAVGSPITLTYNSVGNNLTGFPAGPVSVTSNGTTTNYTYPVPDAAIPYTNGATVTFSGISVQISGTPKNNDTFSIARNSNGVSDNRNALLLGKLQTQSTMAGGKSTYQGVYSQLVSDAGNKGREVQVTRDAQKALLLQAQTASDSLSGVNLDEEAANLLRYQQAYQAAAKMIDIGSKLLDTILAIR